MIQIVLQYRHIQLHHILLIEIQTVKLMNQRLFSNALIPQKEPYTKGTFTDDSLFDPLQLPHQLADNLLLRNHGRFQMLFQLLQTVTGSQRNIRQLFYDIPYHVLTDTALTLPFSTDTGQIQHIDRLIRKLPLRHVICTVFHDLFQNLLLNLYIMKILVFLLLCL